MKISDFILLLCLTLTGCYHTSPVPSNAVQGSTNSYSIACRDLSMLALISNPQTYDKQRVRIKGFIHLEFEGNCIYLHEEDFTQHIEKNGLCLEFKNQGAVDSIFKFSDHYVTIEGVFDSHNLGYMSMNSGCIKQITSLDVHYPDKFNK
jgi:starvation-inducible outer membrane lipoprotein